MAITNAAANIRRSRIAVLAVLLILAAIPAFAQEDPPEALELNENCTVSILNRNALVSPASGWTIPNVPANFGRVRARASCIIDGVTRFGESVLFDVIADGDVNVPPITLGATTPIPEIMTLTATVQTLSAPGATAQLTVNGVYAGNTARNITGSAAGTTYTSSNPAIATVSAEGLVRAATSGTAIMQATNEGASGLLAIRVVLSADSDGDGIPDDVEIAAGLDPGNPVDALEDADHDGLSNIDEYTSGTGINDPDSDDDTIPDGEEATAGADGFVTNPLLPDTDGDGLRDALEIQTGTDPTDRNSFDLTRALSRLDVTPPSFTLLVNTLVGEAYTQLVVTGRLIDGNSIDLTSTTRGTTYTSSDLTICNFGSPDGRVYGANDGACTVTVGNSGFSGTVAGTVRTFAPLAISQIQIPGYANNVEISNGYAFVAAGSAGLQVVDVTNPAVPAIVASRDTSGTAIDVRILGRYAYVADGNAGLQIIDIVNPAAPVLTGGTDTPGEAQDVMVANGIAYVADGGAGLTLINVSSASSPIVASTISIGTTARGVDVSGNYAVVVGDGGTLRIINVANAASPQTVGTLNIGGEPKDVRVSGTLAFVAAYTGGVKIVDFSTANAPVVIGSVPGSAPDGFVPRDVDVAGRFAIFAEQLFPNAVPFVDVTAPSVPRLKGIINFAPLGDYAGTGIAVAGPYVYMTGESFFVGNDFGTSGDTRLFIGQYLPLEDLAGVPPTIAITSPAPGVTQYVGAQLTAIADAQDDVAVAQVQFNVNGEAVFTDTSAPYAYTFTIPAGTSSLSISVTAVDLGGNSASASRTVPVVPDPLTTVSGIAVDAGGAPLVGATVTTINDLSVLSGPGGAFSIFSVPTVRGDIVANIRFTAAGGTQLTGSSAPVPPNRGGVTDVGTIVAIDAAYEQNIGTFVSSCDDCNYLYNLPFPFTFYGVTYSQVYVGTNGYVTFTGGDSTYTETLPAFNSLPRIAAFFDDLYGRSQGGLYVNSSLPGRFVITQQTVQHYEFGGSNTLQIILYADGRIQFAYRGMTALLTGSISGLTPGPGQPFQQVDYSTSRNVEVPSGTAVYEYFTDTNPFDLDNGFVVFSPRAGGGYNVRTILSTLPPQQLDLSGGPAGVSARPVGTEGVTTHAQNIFAKAEVEIRSSTDLRWKGHANTDHRGVFHLKKVPAGGVSVVLKRNGEIVGTGAAVFETGPGKPNAVHLDITPPAVASKP
jgi:hypothetical protein